MMNLIAIAVITVVMALFVYISKRRIGIPIFALAVGHFLGALWVEEVVMVLQALGIYIVSPPLILLVAVVLSLAPALLVVGSGATYKKPSSRLVSAIIFGLTVAAFMVTPFAAYGSTLAEASAAYDMLSLYAPIIMTGGVLLGLADILLTKTHKPPKDDAKH